MEMIGKSKRNMEWRSMGEGGGVGRMGIGRGRKRRAKQPHFEQAHTFFFLFFPISFKCSSI